MRYRQYIRVSTKKQLQGASLEDQQRANAGRAAQLNGIIEHTYVEPGRSAFTENLSKRQAFQQMMIDARARRFDALIVYDLSRFSRQAVVSLSCAAELERLGITVISATEYFDRSTAAGRMTYTMLAAAAQFKSDHLSERMKAVRLGEAQRGILPGPVPVGYRREGKQLYQTPAAEAIRVAFKLYCTGDYGSNRITDAMNATGHTMPDGSPFKVTAVEEIIRCPVYAGLIPCAGQLFPGQHEPIIDAATWERAQEVAQRRAKRRTAYTPQHPLLAGIAVCASCGAPMWHSGGADKPVYVCSAHATRNHGISADIQCIGVKVNATYVEHATCAWLASLALTPGIIDRARALLTHKSTPPPPIRQLDQALKKLKQDFLNDRIGAADYEAQRIALLAQPTPQARELRVEDQEAVLSLVADLPTLLIEASAEERRAIVRQLISEAWLRRRRVIALRPTRLAAALSEAARGNAALNHLVSKWAGWAPGLDTGYTVYDPVVWLEAA